MNLSVPSRLGLWRVSRSAPALGRLSMRLRCSGLAGSVRGRLNCIGQARGLTLTELLIAATVTAVLLVSLCGVYFAVAREWDRQQGQATALLAVSTTCSRVADYVSKACYAATDSRYHANDALWIKLPADTAYGGLFVPVWSGGRLIYRGGAWVVFYLSDSSGSYDSTGSILWAAAWNGWAVVPDRAWSMYYDTDQGRISPVTSIQFSVTVGPSTQVTVTAVSSFKIGTAVNQLSRSRTICLRNS